MVISLNRKVLTPYPVETGVDCTDFSTNKKIDPLNTLNKRLFLGRERGVKDCIAISNPFTRLLQVLSCLVTEDEIMVPKLCILRTTKVYCDFHSPHGPSEKLAARGFTSPLLQ